MIDCEVAEYISIVDADACITPAKELAPIMTATTVCLIILHPFGIKISLEFSRLYEEYSVFENNILVKTV